MRLRSGSHFRDRTPERTPVVNQAQSQLRSQSDPLHTTTSSTGKRPLDESTGPSRGPPSKHARLTRENLKQHTKSVQQKMGRTATPSVSSKSSGKTAETRSAESTKSKNTTTTDRQFSQRILDKNIIEGFGRYKPPRDIVVVKSYLDRDRESASPDQAAFDIHQDTLNATNSEEDVQNDVWELIAKRHVPTDGYFRNSNVAWTQFKSELRDGLSDPKPDRSESFRMEAYPKNARNALKHNLQPGSATMAMPNQAVEFKKMGGNMMCASSQCAYNGAIMTSAAHEIHQYMGQPVEERYGTTEALTIAYGGTDLLIYANHAVSTGSGVEYHHVPLFKESPAFDLDSFKKSYKRTRNAQDWARERATDTLQRLRAHDTRAIGSEQRKITGTETKMQDPRATLNQQPGTPISPPRSTNDTQSIKRSRSRGEARPTRTITDANVKRRSPTDLEAVHPTKSASSRARPRSKETFPSHAPLPIPELSTRGMSTRSPGASNQDTDNESLAPIKLPPHMSSTRKFMQDDPQMPVAALSVMGSHKLPSPYLWPLVGDPRPIPRTFHPTSAPVTDSQLEKSRNRGLADVPSQSPLPKYRSSVAKDSAKSIPPSTRRLRSTRT